METGITQNDLIAQLSKSTHGKLEEYVPMARAGIAQHAEFFAHLITWNFVKGQIRDSKIALPVISLSAPNYANEFRENSLANLAILDPRSLLKAVRFAHQIRTSVVAERPKGSRPTRTSGLNDLERLVTRYLRVREDNWGLWTTTAVQHRNTLKELYSFFHVKPSDMASAILYRNEYPRGSVFESIKLLYHMSPSEAAGTILNKKIPFLIASNAMREKFKSPEVLQALIERMSPTELTTNTKLLSKHGLKTNPALRGAYEKALARAADSKANTLKTSRAAEALEEDLQQDLANKLKQLQEKQIAALGGIDGDWLVLADKSGSMTNAIETARHISATLARMVKGKVHLIFFDTAPRHFDVTGKTLDEIKTITKHVIANGGTSIGCGLLYAVDRNLSFDGIAIISDGGENPGQVPFSAYAKAYSVNTGRQVPIYFYKVSGSDRDWFTPNCASSQVPIETFDLTGKQIDYYSLPNLCRTMNVSRYSLADEILATPLLTQDEVFGRINQNHKNTRKEEFAHV